jgi:hypothetical protein
VRHIPGWNSVIWGGREGGCAAVSGFTAQGDSKVRGKINTLNEKVILHSYFKILRKRQEIQ